jgi:amino acid transporter
VALELATVSLLIAAGLWHPARGLVEASLHPMIAGVSGGLMPAPAASLMLGAVSAAYATVGGDQAIAFGEELRDPHRRMGDVVMWAGLIGALATALPVIVVVIGARDLPAMLESPAPFVAFVSSVGGPLAGRVLSAVVVLAVFNALIAQIMSFGRLFFSLGRDGIFQSRVDRLLASVDARSGAPRAATVVLALASGACCLLKSHTLLVFGSGLLVSGLTLVSLAVIVGRRKGQTGQAGYWRSPLFPLMPVLGLLMSAVFLIADLMDPDAGRPGILILIAIIAAGAAWYGLVLKRRPGGWAPRLD